MTPPISIDGTDITGATIDDSDVQEITVDGDTVFTSTPDIPESQNLQHRWPTDEGSGTTVADAVGNADGSFGGSAGSNPDWVTGLGGNGDAYLDYPDTGDIVSYADDVLQSAWSELTFSCWAMVDAPENTLVTQAVGSGSTNFLIRYNSGTLEFFFDGSVIASVNVSSASGWHMITLTFGSGTAKGYFDDSLEGSTSGLSMPNWSNDRFETGNREEGASAPVNQNWGEPIDDPKVWDSELSGSQVADLYAATEDFY